MADEVALLIGNSVYEHAGLARLSAPSADVIALREVLGDAAIAGFETDLLLNAGLDEARAAINRLFANRHPDDTVLLYYSGHGVRDSHGDLYLALPRTDPGDPAPMSLDADFIRKRMARSGSRRQVLMLDCCHSGAFQPGTKSGAGDLLVRTDFDPGGHGRFVLAASGAEESAFEQDGRSIFTRHIVDALRNGEAAPEREEITIADLHRYVARRANADNPAMQPRLWVDEQTGPLAIARNPNPRRPLPPDAVEALASDDLHRALGAAARLLFMHSHDPRSGREVLRLFRQRLERADTLNAILADWLRDVVERWGEDGSSAAPDAEIDRLASEREAAAAAAAAAEARAETTRAEAASARRQAAESGALAEALRADLSAAQAALDQARAASADAAREAERRERALHSQAADNKAQVAELRRELADRDAEIARLKSRPGPEPAPEPLTWSDRLWGRKPGETPEARRRRLWTLGLIGLGLLILYAATADVGPAPMPLYPAF